MKKRFLCALLFAVVVAIGFTVTAYAENDFIMRCESLWPFC